MTGFDDHRASRAVAAAARGPAGLGLVMSVLAGIPGVVHNPGRRGLFRSSSEHIQIGDWRYQVAADGRLQAAHVINEVAIAESVLAADSVGAHIARALAQVVAHYGAAVIPDIDAAVEALEAGTPPGF